METKSATCAECRRLNDTIVNLEKRIESLQQISEDEHFIDSAAASVIQTTGLPNPDVPTLSASCGSTEHPGIDLGDTIPWNFPDNPSAPEDQRTAWSVILDQPHRSLPHSHQHSGTGWEPDQKQEHPGHLLLPEESLIELT
ncbi:uncharacterized protein V6R79_019068 [Siganus canaliculatus]